MAKDTRANFLRELAKVEPQLARAFTEAMQDVTSASQLRSIERAIQRGIETGNILGAVEEVQALIPLERGFFSPLSLAIGNGFLQGALYQTDLVPRRPSRSAPVLVVRFDMRHERAEAWVRRNSGALINELQEQARLTIRETIDEGVRDNIGSRGIARSLLGTMQGSQRRGALIGLHSTQAAYVRRMRAELQNLDRGYFSKKLRDRRFDGTVRNAIASGKPLTAAQIDKLTGRYADRLLQYRARTIARTETHKAMNAGRFEAIQQMIDDGKVSADKVTKRWQATIGQYTRDHHIALNGQTLPWGQPFMSPETGYPMQGPHDEGAPAVDVVNCRCVLITTIDYLG